MSAEDHIHTASGNSAHTGCRQRADAGKLEEISTGKILTHGENSPFYIVDYILSCTGLDREESF